MESFTAISNFMHGHHSLVTAGVNKLVQDYSSFIASLLAGRFICLARGAAFNTTSQGDEPNCALNYHPQHAVLPHCEAHTPAIRYRL